MYLLTKTTQSLILKPSTTDEVHWTASWVEVSTTGPTVEEKSAVGISTSTSDVTLVPAPSSSAIRHHVKSISITTADVMSVTVYFKESSTEGMIVFRGMDVKYSLNYEDGQGWYLFKPTD